MRYRVRYLHADSYQIARFAWMEKQDALTIARQIIGEGERKAQIEDETGQLWGVEGLAGSLGQVGSMYWLNPKRIKTRGCPARC